MLQVVDDSLSVMGEEPRKAIYQYLLTIHSLPKEDIPAKTDEFVSGLKKALGSASAVVERLILKRLYQRIGNTFRESQGLEFRDSTPGGFGRIPRVWKVKEGAGFRLLGQGLQKEQGRFQDK